MEWRVYYYDKADGTSPVEDYIDALALKERAKTLAFIGTGNQRAEFAAALCRFIERRYP